MKPSSKNKTPLNRNRTFGKKTNFNTFKKCFSYLMVTDEQRILRKIFFIRSCPNVTD